MTNEDHGAATNVTSRGSYSRRMLALHIGIVVVGALMLVGNAFSTNVWYDETYSVAIAQYPFEDIWRIGAKDVHPVLYYFALHVIYSFAGPNIVAYRLFSVAGSIVLSILGITHVRRVVDERTAVVFSAFAYFLPWSMRIAFQIRMYSWLAVVVMLLFIYSWRMIRSLIAREPGAPTARYWVVLTICSVLAAYLHYYGAIAAFVLQALVLGHMIKYRAGIRSVLIWAGCAALAVLLYAPWLVNVVAQVSANSGGRYWIQFTMMGSVSELMLFPFNAPEFEHLSLYGLNHAALGVLLSVATCGCCIAALFSYGKALGKDEESTPESMRPSVFVKSPASFGVTVLALTSLIAFLASFVLGSAFLYYRYLTVCIGPLSTAMAYVFTRTDDKKVGAIASLLAITCGVVSYCCLVDTSHNPGNEKVLAAYESTCEMAEERNGGSTPLVLSDDIYTAAILTVSDRGLPITYVADFQNPAYECYGPNLIMGETKESVLEEYRGSLVYCGRHDDARQLAEEYDAEVVYEDANFHVYSGQWFDIAILDFG